MPDYIPQPDIEADTWFQNFADLATAAPATYALTAGQALDATNAANAYTAALALALEPSTRTPVTVAAKDAAKATAYTVIRPLAMIVAGSGAVSNGNKVAIGVTVRQIDRPPIPAPTAFPLLGFRAATPLQTRLIYNSSDTPTSRAKAAKSTGMEVWTAVGTVAAVDPAACTLRFVATKTPFVLDHAPEQIGKVLTVFARFVNASGPGGVAAVGPWSSPLVTTIIG